VTNAPASIYHPRMPRFTKQNAREMQKRRKSWPDAATWRSRADLRAVVGELLEKNADNVSLWLDQVAEGDPAKGIPADPAAALNIIAKLAEYAAPRMARVTLDDAGNPATPIAAPIKKVAIHFVGP